MGFKVTKMLQVIIVLIFLNATAVNAQQPPSDDLTLENELNNLEQSEAKKPNEEPTAVQDEFTLEQPVVSPDATSEMNAEAETPFLETLEQEYALNGFSMGLAMSNQNYNIKASINNNNISTNLSSKSSDIQNAGVTGRYAILPFDKVGSDINISISSSINHESAGISPITSYKGEVNLGYAIRLGVNFPVYILAGLGFELIKGTDIEKILNPGGSMIQIGGGFGLGKRISIEASYAYSEHRLSDVFIRNATLVAGSGSVMDSKTAVTSNIIQTRLSFNY